MSQPILVTGATGHLGANLVRRLVAEKRAVRVLVRPGRDHSSLDGLDVETTLADLRDPSAVDSAVRGCGRIYHCAALVSTIDGDAAHRQEIFETNVLGTKNLLEAAAKANVHRVVVSGSLSATGHLRHSPTHEGVPFNPFEPQLPYGHSKHMVEHLCLEAHAAGLEVVIAVSCAIIGPHDYIPSRMGQVLIDVAMGKMNAYIPGGFEFVSTRDIVEGHVLAMEKGRSGHKYLISTAYASVDELLDLFAEVSGQRKPRLRLSPALMALLAGVADQTWYRLFPSRSRRFTPAAVRLLRMQRRVDLTKARSELGYAPTELREAVELAYQDFVRRGVIRPAAAASPRFISTD